MRPRYFILKGHEPVPVASVEEWARKFEINPQRIVARDTIGNVRVSTVFLGIDHNFLGDGPPLIFETMVFGASALDGEQDRYSTWDEAEAGHAAMVARVKGGLH